MNVAATMDVAVNMYVSANTYVAANMDVAANTHVAANMDVAANQTQLMAGSSPDSTHGDCANQNDCSNEANHPACEAHLRDLPTWQLTIHRTTYFRPQNSWGTYFLDTKLKYFPKPYLSKQKV